MLCFIVVGFLESSGKIFLNHTHQGNNLRGRNCSVYFQVPFALHVRVPPGALLSDTMPRGAVDLQTASPGGPGPPSIDWT